MAERAKPKLSLRLLRDRMAICRLSRQRPVPEWARRARGLVSITRTAHELSIVCPEHAPPQGTTCDKGWRALQVEGPLDFALTGILVSLAAPLAAAGLCVFALSTYDTDYLLIRGESLEEAIKVLKVAGHSFRRA